MTYLPGSARPNSYMEFMQIITPCMHFGLGVNFVRSSLPLLYMADEKLKKAARSRYKGQSGESLNNRVLLY